MFYSLASCEDQLEVNSLSSDITLERTTVKANEPVVFNIGGNADYITFYSGEEGREYKYKDRTSISGGKGEFSFTTVTASSQKPAENTSLEVFISTDFYGDYTWDGINDSNIKWQPLNDKITFSDATTSNDVPSGIIDITESAEKERPIYLAFKYTGKSTDTSQNPWIIRQPKIDFIVGEQIFPVIRNITDCNFKFIYPPEQDETKVWTVNTQQIRNAGNVKNDYEAWAVSKGFYLNKVSPDQGEAIVSMDNRIDNFSYIYEIPGVYTVTFVSKTATIQGEQESIKEFVITVEPNEPAPTPPITIIPEKARVKINEPLRFTLRNVAVNADYFMFYSGEAGHRYAYKDAEFADGGKSEFSFGTITAPKQDKNYNFQLYFLGEDIGETLTWNVVNDAPWKDFTNSSVWATTTTAPDNNPVPSGAIDISEFHNKLVRFGFKYVGAEGQRHAAWIVRNLKLEFTLDGVTKTIISDANDAAAQFIYPDVYPGIKWDAYPVSSKQIRYAGSGMANTPYSCESWVVSKPFYLNKVASDVGVGLDINANTYEYIYTQTGEYTVSFAYNLTGGEEKVIEFTVVVEP